jgi:hypothetical protein
MKTQKDILQKTEQLIDRNNEIEQFLKNASKSWRQEDERNHNAEENKLSIERFKNEMWIQVLKWV